MDNNYRGTNIDKIEYATVVGQNKLLRASFSWMALAMVLTTLSALLFGFIPELTSMLFTETETGIKLSIFSYVLMFAPLAFILALNFGFNRMSYATLIAVFLAYSAVMGMSLSFIFFIYAIGSIIKVFLSTTALFALMAIAGYTTKTDLTKLRNILFIGLIGIVIASLINMFMHSAQMDYIISIIGVIVFTGLTAYDVQKIKQMGEEADGSTLTSKLGIMGALTLYMDFINLFMFLLRLFGRRD
ncbi:MAG: Inner rane protein YbhL [Bacteroidetes bacterium]|jgi:FtsH-binding integral membrane protein|nr:Inner rane protein YbhL [Bacteroidota bacterium]